MSGTASQGTVSGSGSTVTAALGNLADGGQATITILADVAAAASGTLVNAAYRVQEAYGASQFGTVTGAIAITELRLLVTQCVSCE